MSQFVLALDGGGTKTAVALADISGNVTNLPPAAGINAVDNPRWRQDLDGALARVFEDDRQIVSALAGMPAFGESRELDAVYRQAIAERLGPAAEVTNDVFMAYDGAFADGEGVLALAGTGAMSVATGLDGTYRRAGGFGHEFGDEGSAYWIGRKALQKASWVVDGRLDAPAFLERIVAAIDASPGAPLSGLLEWHAGLKHPRSAIAALARQVDAAAEDGDAIARDLLVQAAGHIAQLVVSVRHAARLPPDASWSFAGGLFASAIFADAVAGKLGTAPVAPAFPPLGGGLLRAARAAGWNISPAWRENVHAGLLARRD